MKVFETISVWFICLIFLAACGWTESFTHSNVEAVSSDSDDGKAKIGPELAAQLESMGYVVKESSSKSTVKDSPYENADINYIMEKANATFVFYDVERNLYVRHNPERASQRFSPHSTFKIPNTLIALDSGIVVDSSMTLEWDSKKYPKETWWDTVLKENGMQWDREHTIRSAFHQSVVWYYKELALKIGPIRMMHYLGDFSYGNHDISGGIDSFWLGSSLKISAEEQITFLTQFVNGKLALKDRTYDVAKQIFEARRNGEYTLYAKTGGGTNIGWYVGFVEHENHHYVFAFNMSGTYDQTFKQRIGLSMAALQELGVWPLE